MSITDKRMAEIKAFKNTDFSDTPELTDEQVKQLKPSHYRKREPVSFAADESGMSSRYENGKDEEGIWVPAVQAVIP